MRLEPNERTVMLEGVRGGMARHVVAEPAVWQEHACRIAGRVLTEKEWGELPRGAALRPGMPRVNPAAASIT